MLKKIRLVLLVSTIAFNSILIEAQEPTYTNSLVEYLTATKLEIETEVLTKYCSCNDRNGFIKKYNEVAKKINSSINENLVVLSSLRAQPALQKFTEINKDSNALAFKTSLEELLDKFTGHQCSSGQSPKRFVGPSAISIAEFTGIANSIIGLINGGKERKNARRDRLIGIMESLKLPSIHGYECKKSDE
jgi:hypothetical protein